MFWRTKYVRCTDNYVPCLDVPMYENVNVVNFDNGLRLHILRVYRDVSDLIDVAHTVTAGKIMHRDFFNENQAWLGKQGRLVQFELNRVYGLLHSEPLYNSILYSTIVKDLDKVKLDVKWVLRVSRLKGVNVK